MTEDKSYYTALEIRILVTILSKLLKKEMDERLAKHEKHISGLQYAALTILSHGDETLSELSDKMLLESATLVPVIESLVELRLVDRKKDSKDRRKSPLSITKKGQKIIKEIPFFDENDAFIKGLSKIENASLTELLSSLSTLVTEMSGNFSLINEIESNIYLYLTNKTDSRL